MVVRDLNVRGAEDHTGREKVMGNQGFGCINNRLALKSGIDGQPESPQVGHSHSANIAQRLNSCYVVASSD